MNGGTGCSFGWSDMTHRWSTALRTRRVAGVAAGVGLSLLAAACSETPQTAFNPRSEYATAGLDLFVLIVQMGVVIGVVVEAILIWAAIRYRRRSNDRLPTQAPAPSSAMDVEVIGHQFWWEFQYPEANVVTANELHLPIGRTANLILRSDDVIHSFWVPALGGKRDAFPGHTNYIWMTPNSTGEFPGQCYQLCGYSHGNMRERAIIQSQADFQTWLTDQQQPAVQSADPAAAEGAQLFQTKACSGCHTIAGTAAQARTGPNLTHFASRGTFAGSILDTTPANVRTWLKDPPAVKPGSIMPNLGLNDHELDALVAYLQSLK